jgi:hypothetical protein
MWLRYDPCSRRELAIQANGFGTRGPDWPVTKSPGTLRMIAPGGSSTFGPNNPFEATWPALLEKRLSESLGGSVEALNERFHQGPMRFVKMLYYSSAIHWSDAGSALLADVIAAGLTQHLNSIRAVDAEKVGANPTN